MEEICMVNYNFLFLFVCGNLGYQIDGFITVVSHTYVLQEARVITALDQICDFIVNLFLLSNVLYL